MRYLEPGGAAVRRRNTAAVVEALRPEPTGSTVAVLATRTGLSRPTVDAVVGDLVTAGVVRLTEATPTGARGGRPARTVELAADAGCVAGIDVGASRVRAVVTDLAGRVLAERTDRLPAGEPAPGARIALVRTVVGEAVRATGHTLRELRGAALAVPGVIGPDERITHSLAVPDWSGDRPGQTLARGWRCPVALENDIKAAALAEQRAGITTAPTTDIAYLQLGHRISLALVIDGRIRQGHHRVAGELGTLRGMRWTSTSRRGQLRWRTGRTGREVFVAAAAGRRDAAEEIEAFCAEIAPTVATVLLAVDPELLVVGGGLSRAGATLLDPLRRAVHGLLTTADRPEVVGSRLGADATVLGTLGLAFEAASTPITSIPGVSAPWSTWTTWRAAETADRTGKSAP
ncbi:putative NBD/HSP70 family sugar kinase [Friedmanniella endophytica]|uniref:Putative NBD/HSP70 family sugar kinase n=1 Tax=Microlunatus kandeliicorticis TaxID=1759536 RepID=A0A7W3IR64_9ACTN|nr:ROK family protein [Microlunatus kandeliicorticis]MBA8793718.1 putative NBD/HSP70 family sugar kinase [Microlunatus kandeliicorticis]